MCHPLAIGAAVAAGSYLYAGIQQGQQADARDAAYKRNAAAANAQATESYFQTTVRQAQEREAVALRISDLQRDSEEIQGAVAVRAGEANIGGNAAAAAIQEVQRDEGEAIFRELRNAQIAELQGQFDKRATHLRTQASIIAAQPGAIAAPNPFEHLATGLQVASSLDGAFDSDDDPTNTNRPGGGATQGAGANVT